MGHRHKVCPKFVEWPNYNKTFASWGLNQVSPPSHGVSVIFDKAQCQFWHVSNSKKTSPSRLTLTLTPSAFLQGTFLNHPDPKLCSIIMVHSLCSNKIETLAPCLHVKKWWPLYYPNTLKSCKNMRRIWESQGLWYFMSIKEESYSPVPFGEKVNEEEMQPERQ